MSFILGRLKIKDKQRFETETLNSYFETTSNLQNSLFPYI